jgi:hypothetical protein
MQGVPEVVAGRALRRQRRITGILVAVLIGVTSGAVLAISTSGDESRQQMAIPDPRILDPNAPLLVNGKQTTLEAARKIVGFPVYRPQHALASDQSLLEVWAATDGQPTVGLKYGSGLRVFLYLWPPASAAQAAQLYDAQASETGAGWTQSINGHAAWVAPADSQAPGFPPGGVVDMTIGQIEVSIQGDFPIQQLVEIAESVG